ncbi:MAG: NUDIX hydrolase [Desulforudis sp.]|jgi:isopentenyl-diphosphate delta-isomerase|nr:MAG: NUDIX hydrolase [Desulforudis sp.]
MISHIKRVHHDELLDIVDTSDIVIGQRWRSEIYQEGACNFRVVNAFLLNNAGKLWIPRRASGKKLFPMCLDMSMGGHVAAGESYEEAFARELMEELNLDVRQIECRTLGKLSPYQHGVSAFMTVYEIKLERAPEYNKTDFCEYFWLTPQEVLDALEKGDRAKDDLPRLVRYFYPQQEKA